CPYCKTQAVELQSRVNELKAQGLGLAVITYDSPAILADFKKRRGITFPLLSDAGSATIKSFGILNTTVAEGTTNYGIPFPGTFLVDRTGKVTSRFFEAAYQERNTVSTIMIALGTSAAPATATQVETDHLRITTYLSDETVAPGSLFSIVFDIEPTPGIHVYAPGAKDYRVIGFRPDHNPLLVVRPIEYPASEIYHFKPLDERVPVYQKPFRLVQPMMVSAAQDVRASVRAMDAIAFDGTIEYQACDDQRCFNPRSLRVSYAMKVRQLDTERATVPK
ncbi:MAG: redoxin domain-containing protein, partial [Vicinamibacterales bacterium]